jgi:hypothetical protein
MKERLIDWWRRHRWTRPRIRRTIFYAVREELPSGIPRDELLVVGSRGDPKWALLACPCGRGHQLTINLSKSRSPYWEICEEVGGPSLSPSIDSVSPYRCHFWLKQGLVDWVKDYP